MNIKEGRENLTQAEILHLPLELKVCFSIQPWNKGLKPLSIEEWAYEIGFSAMSNEDIVGNERTHEERVKEAIEYATVQVQFINSIINSTSKEERSEYSQDIWDNFKPVIPNKEFIL